MKDVMKDEDLEKVSGGWSMSRCLDQNIVVIQFLTEPQEEALRNLSKELGLNWQFSQDTLRSDTRPRIKVNGKLVLDLKAPWDPTCGRCDIKDGFNDEIFARIKQVIGEPDEIINL